MSVYRDNVFIRFGDTKEPEEIITDGLSTVLHKCSASLSETVAETLSPVDLVDPKFHQEKTALALESELSNKETYLVGLANVDGEYPELAEKTSVQPDQSRFDLTITDDEHVIVVEVKTHSSGFKKLDKYADILGIDERRRVDFQQWRTLTDALQKFDSTGNLERELIADFCELIKFNSTATTVSVSPYGSDNSQRNHLKITQRSDSVRKTPYASPNPIFALQIESDKSGSQTVRFSPGEWAELIDRLGDDEREAIKKADFEAFNKYKGKGQQVHASVGSEDTHQKVLQTATSKGDFAVGFKHRKPGKSVYDGQGPFPMLTESEFNTLFEKLSFDQRCRLVEQRELSVFLEQLDS